MLELLEGEKKPDIVRLVTWLRIAALCAVIDCVMLFAVSVSDRLLSFILLAVGIVLLVAIVWLDRTITKRGGKVNWNLRRP
jgi:hypothetical protein